MAAYAKCLNVSVLNLRWLQCLLTLLSAPGSAGASGGGGCTPCSVGVGGDGGAPPTQLEQVEVEGIMGEGAPQNEKDGNDW